MRKRLRDDSGQILIMAALMLPVLLAFAGLAIDVGYLIDSRRQMQMAADAGAVGGAIVATNYPCSGSDIAANRALVQTAARTDAGKNNFTHGGNITVTVNCPPTSGPFNGQDKYAEVIVSQPKAAFLMAVLGFGNTTVRARAVAGTSGTAASNVTIFGCASGSLGCASGTISQALGISGGGDIVVGGSITVNSNASDAINLSGGSTANPTRLLGSSIKVVGNYNPNPSTASAVYSPTPVTGATAAIDPFAGVSPPALGVGCSGTYAGGTFSTSQTLPCGTYTTGIKVSGNGVTVTFAPGTYVINGDVGGWALDIEGGATANSGAGGVSFYAASTAGGLKISGSGTTATLKAPTNVTYPFIWYQDRENTNNAALGSNATVSLEGIVYMRKANWIWNGGGGGGGLAAYTVFVVNKFTYSGGSFFIQNNFCSVLADCSGFVPTAALGE